MSGYLRIKVIHVQAAWENATVDSRAPESSSSEELYHARRAAVVHVPQEWPHAVVCGNCHVRYPCAAALWGFGLLKQAGWALPDLFDLIETVEQRTAMTTHSTLGKLHRRTAPSTPDMAREWPPVDASRMSWNTSTMLLQTLTDRLHEEGRGQGNIPEIPYCDSESEELPRRPLDLGVGLWR